LGFCSADDLSTAKILLLKDINEDNYAKPLVI